jgi:hypothetical protein
MSALHQIRDITELDGPTFFRLAYRLPAYEGAARVDLEGWLEELTAEPIIEKSDSEIRAELYENYQERPEEEDDVVQPNSERVLTLEELVAAGPAKPEISQNVPIFEVVRSTD